MPSWTVHATVAEPPELLAAFVAHYLSLGADEIHLCLDRWDDETLELLHGFDRVRVTCCDTNYWRSLRRRRPDDHQGRQILNAQSSFRSCKTDWFFFCDADEFLTSGHRISDLLATIPATLDHMRIAMAERTFALRSRQDLLFDGALRKTWHAGPDKKAAVYGDTAKYLTAGLSGHIQGKSFVRRGADVLIRIHFPIRSRIEQLRTSMGQPPEMGEVLKGAWLVHFDGMTRLHWRMKLVRQAINRPLAFARKPIWFRIAAHIVGRRAGLDGPRFRLQGRGRENQISDMMAARNNSAAIQQMDRIITLTKKQRQALKNQHRALIRLPLTPVATLDKMRPDLSLNMTAAQFNLRLRKANPDLCEHILSPNDPL